MKIGKEKIKNGIRTYTYKEDLYILAAYKDHSNLVPTSFLILTSLSVNFLTQ